MSAKTTHPKNTSFTSEAPSPAALTGSYSGGGGRTVLPSAGSGDPPGGGGGRGRLRGRPRRKMLKRASEVLHKAVAGMLLVAAVILLVDTAYTFVTHHPLSAAAAMAVVSGALLPVIIVEIMTTVDDTSGGSGLRVLQALMVIGIISSVREILMITALSFDSSGRTVGSHAALMLGANTVVVLGLTVAFILIRRLAKPSSTGRASGRQ